MKALRSLYYWAVGMLYFGSLLIGILIRSRFQPLAAYNTWIQGHLRRVFRLVGTQITLEYAEPIPRDRPLIFMANHTSLLDIPLLQLGVPGAYIGIMAQEQFEYFLYGRVIRRLGHIAIDRSSLRRSLAAFESAQRHLQQGGWIVVLPEGGRSLDGRLMPFKKLPFKFALESGVDIVPLGISGAYAMKPKHTWHLTPGNITIRFGAIIAAADFKEKEANELRDQVQQAIHDLLEPFEVRGYETPVDSDS